MNEENNAGQEKEQEQSTGTEMTRYASLDESEEPKRESIAVEEQPQEEVSSDMKSKPPISAKSIICFTVYAVAFVLLVVSIIVSAIVPNTFMLVIFGVLVYAIVGTIIYFFVRKKEGRDILGTITLYCTYIAVGIAILVLTAILHESKSDKEVNDGGTMRKLKFVENKKDYEGSGKNPYYGKSYQLYRDDIDVYWRSYDDGKTFVKMGYKDRY